MAAKKSSSGEPSAPAPRRWLRKMLLTATALLLLIWFAPAIVAHTPLRQIAISSAASGVEGKIHCGSASLGWLSPVSLREIRLTDAEGRPLLEVDELRTETSLFSLALDRANLGVIRIARPRLLLELRSGGSNLEDALAPWLKQPETQSTGDLALEIAGGEIQIVDQWRAEPARVSELNATIETSASGSGSVALKLSAVITDAARESGSIQANLQMQPAAAEASGGDGRLEIVAEAVPLTGLRALIARLVDDVEATGSLSGTVTCEWSPHAGRQIQLQAFTIRGFSLRTPALPSADSIQAQYIVANGSITIDGDNLVLKSLAIESDVARLRADGGFLLSEINEAQFLAALRRRDYQLQAEVDLARLAAAAPSLMHVREGARLESGTISATLSSQLQQGQRRWSGRVESSDLSAVADGKQIAWTQPIRAALEAHLDDAGPVIDEFTCQSEFLRVSGGGSLAQGELTGQADLNRLARQLTQIFELGSYKLAGTAGLAASWRRTQAGEFSAEGDINVEGFELAAPNMQPWREAKLQITARAAGASDAARLLRLDRAALTMQSAGDQLSLETTAPIDPFSAAGPWPLSCRLTGSLDTWSPRIQIAARPLPWRLSGAIDVSAAGVASSRQVQIAQASARFENFRAHGDSTSISESVAQFQGSGNWTRETGIIHLEAATLQSSTLSLGIDKLTLDPQSAGIGASGDVAFRADLAKLAAWLRDPRKAPGNQLFALAEGQVRFHRQPAATDAQWSATLSQVAFVAPQSPGAGPGSGPWKTLWVEDQVVLSGAAQYEHASRLLRLEQCDVSAGSLRAGAQGTIADIGAQYHVDLKGDVQYDLQDLARKARPAIGNSLQIAGRDARQFSIRGPLVAAAPSGGLAGNRPVTRPVSAMSSRPQQVQLIPDELTGEASLAWTSASYQGIELGRGELKSNLQNGVVNFAPIELQVSEGTISLTPRVALNGVEPMLLLGKESRAQNLRIAPEMCRSWLKYVAPPVADATQAEGRFSVQLEQSQTPLASPSLTEARGVLAVHSAHLGPGPLTREILWIARQIKAIAERRPLEAALGNDSQQWVVLPEQNVDFHVTGGRVHHRNLLMHAGNVEIRTTGSVGMDNSLALTAYVPIRDEWVAREPILAPLKGQTLQIPIAGTLSQPRPDKRVLEQIGRRTIENLENEAGRILQDQLNRGLDRLFGPPR